MLFDGLFSPAAISANWTEVASNRIPYLGEGLFPARKKAGLDLSWIRGSKGLPISLMPSAFDAKATFRDRPGLTKTETEMPFFREGFKLKEKDRQDILRASDSNDPYLDMVLANVFDDANNLLEGAMVVPERMRMALLVPTNGVPGISIQANGVDYTYNYDPNSEWSGSNYFVLTGPRVWTATTTADPFDDFRTAKNAVVDKTGNAPAIAIMNSATFNLLGKIDAVKNRFLTTIGKTVGYISDADITAVFNDASGLTIVVYDKKYKDESGVVQKFVPDNYVALIPDGPLGSTYYGTTPEEADLRSGANVQVSIVNTGVAITQIVDPHPVNVNTFASEIVLPSYERMDEVALIKVV